LINNGLETISDNAFKGFRNSTNENTINNIIFREKNLKRIETVAFYKNFLDSMDFSECNLTDERMNDLFYGLESVNSIQEIKFENNQISYINRTWLKYVNIKKVFFGSNRITELNQYLFWYENLNTLDLSFNRFSGSLDSGFAIQVWSAKHVEGFS
jgi:Leucine-rich repeat (LRR) protein